MSRIFLSFVLIATFFAQVADAKDPILKFKEDGKFKIAQFTDMHICLGRSDYCDTQLVKTMARLSSIANQEKPDILVFTGDIETGGDAKRGWDRLLDSLDKFKIPFCITFGNHDPERLPRSEMAARIVKSPYSLNKLNKAGELADIEIEVLASQSNNPAFLLYCLDSHDYSTVKHVKGYGWFTSQQVEWLRESCHKRTVANNGVPMNSLAFFHICLPEYVSAWGNPKKNSVGKAAENECPGALNTGMFAAMVEEGQRAFSSWILEDDGRVVHRMRFQDGSIKR